MKFSDFKWLDLPSQAYIIYRHGVYLSERSQDDLFVALYQVNDFYVEVFYRLSNSEIIKFISFHSDVLLEPYLNRIQLKELFNELPVQAEQ